MGMLLTTLQGGDWDDGVIDYIAWIYSEEEYCMKFLSSKYMQQGNLEGKIALKSIIIISTASKSRLNILE